MKLLYQINVLILFSFFSVTLQATHHSLPYYIGAVVEYSPVLSTNTSEKAADANANNYVKFVEKAAYCGADILVFPESSLSISTSSDPIVSRSEAASYIPPPEEKVVPCDDTQNKYSYALRTLSCAAKNNSLYVAINHREKADCESTDNGCPSDKLLIYNTNVVFDRQGRVVARYRKYNLFGEYGTNITSEPVPSTFVTDFGVTFGQFVCFDILFETPALTLVRHLNVTDILFSSHWFSELPFLYSVEAHAAWAYANDANVLSAGHSNPYTASGGSGIFMGRSGYDHVIMENEKTNLLLVAKIPKVNATGKRSIGIEKEKHEILRFLELQVGGGGSESGPKNFVHMVDKLEPYTTVLLDPKSKRIFNDSLCYNKHCCRFEIEMNFDENVTAKSAHYYRYRIAIFDGKRDFSGFAIGGIKVCGLMSCVNDTLAGCGRLFEIDRNVVTPTQIVKMKIETTLKIDSGTFIMPVTFSRSMLPLNATDFSYNVNFITDKQTSNYEMSLIKPTNDLLSFALYGRHFADDQVIKGSSSKSFLSPLSLLTVFLILLRNPINS